MLKLKLNNRSGSMRLMRLVLLPMILLPLAGCLTLTTGTHFIDTSCHVFVPLSYSSSHDTAQTVAGIKSNNAKLASLCPKAAK